MIYIPITKELKKKLQDNKSNLKKKYNATFTYDNIITKALELLEEKEAEEIPEALQS